MPPAPTANESSAHPPSQPAPARRAGRRLAGIDHVLESTDCDRPRAAGAGVRAPGARNRGGDGQLLKWVLEGTNGGAPASWTAVLSPPRDAARSACIGTWGRRGASGSSKKSFSCLSGRSAGRLEEANSAISSVRPATPHREKSVFSYSWAVCGLTASCWAISLRARPRRMEGRQFPEADRLRPGDRRRRLQPLPGLHRRGLRVPGRRPRPQRQPPAVHRPGRPVRPPVHADRCPRQRLADRRAVCGWRARAGIPGPAITRRERAGGARSPSRSSDLMMSDSGLECRDATTART